jgi:hypothetical protein
VKYGILDLTFCVDGFLWTPEDSGGTMLLKEFGFAAHDTDPQQCTDMYDPTCLQELNDDIAKEQCLLRVFLEKKPGYWTTPEYMREQLQNGWFPRMSAASEAGEAAYQKLVEECFPAEFTVTDSCITNASFIWFHKHSYL